MKKKATYTTGNIKQYETMYHFMVNTVFHLGAAGMLGTQKQKC